MTYVQKLKYIILCLLTHMFYLMFNVLLQLNVLLLCYVTVHGLYFSISICYARLVDIFVIWPPSTSNSIMAEKYEAKREQ